MTGVQTCALPIYHPQDNPKLSNTKFITSGKFDIDTTSTTDPSYNGVTGRISVKGTPMEDPLKGYNTMQWMVDAPTTSSKFIDQVRRDYTKKADGVVRATATEKFATYIVYEKKVIGVVRWQLNSVWDARWTDKNPFFATYEVYNKLSVGSIDGSLGANPMSAAEIAVINSTFGRQRTLDLPD